LSGKNLVFTQANEIINLAGIMGGMSTACDKNTNTVIIECAYFNPEKIIGKSVKYDLQSDAAYKFERGVDHSSHEKVLRRFINIVEQHVDIKSIAWMSKNVKNYQQKSLSYDLKKINQILGTSIDDHEFRQYLNRLNFEVKNNEIKAPFYRSDISTQNDIAEEIAI
jgi:phenylalanyl-tRNA synthetase beta chain